MKINAATMPETVAAWGWAPGWMPFLAAVAVWAGIAMPPVWIFLVLRRLATRKGKNP